MNSHDRNLRIIIRFFYACFLLLVFSGMMAGCIKKGTSQYSEILKVKISKDAVNINEASVSELERLPFVGAKTAKEIVRHRSIFGRFRRPEHLILVKGISERRFLELRKMIKIK